MTHHSRILAAFCKKGKGSVPSYLKKMTHHSRIPAAFCKKGKGSVGHCPELPEKNDASQPNTRSIL
jgi:hypothetical protein